MKALRIILAAGMLPILSSCGVADVSKTSTLDLSSTSKNSFVLNGNDWTSASKLGLQGSYPLSFITNNQERLTVDASGNIGIGTTSPSAFMHLYQTPMNATGTIATTSGSAVMTGTGTQFLSELKVGDIISRAGAARTVVNIADNSTLTVDNIFSNTSAATTFQIMKKVIINSSQTIFGKNSSTPIFSGNIYGGVVPSYEFVSPESAGYDHFTNLMVFRNNVNSAYNVVRNQRIGFLMKFGPDSQATDVQGGAGMVLETTTAYLGNPYLYFINGNARRMTLTNTGSVGIGTTTPSYTLDVTGTMRVTGQAYTTTGNGSFTVVSDMRLKKVNASYNRGLHEILSIDVIKFNYRKENPFGADATKEYVGVSANELQKQIPEAIETHKKDGTEYLMMNITPVFWTVINAVKELYNKILNNEQELREIKSEIASKESEYQNIKNRLDKAEAENSKLKKYLCVKDPGAPFC